MTDPAFSDAAPLAVEHAALDVEEGRAAPTAWRAPVLRSIPAIAVGLVITFTADHSPAFGLVMLSGFGLGTALVLALLAARAADGDLLRGLHVGLAVIAGVVGVLALIVLMTASAGLALLLLLIGGYAVLAGALELVWGIRHRDRSPLARDAVVIGVGTLALAVVLALVGDPVSAVGFFGAYAVVLGIFLLIAGLTLRWPPSAKESSAS